ncbi:MAG: hypothetical protein K8M05_33390 [Deltaproteobacteria bacterium]|nr:hypothetical protein [Kofleriaceae bacterium]
MQPSTDHQPTRADRRYFPHRLIGRLAFATASIALVVFLFATGYRAGAAVFALLALIVVAWPRRVQPAHRAP